MEWFRSVHGAPRHPKWQAVARKSGQPVSVVVSVVWALMDHASRHAERGRVDDLDADDLSAYLMVDEGDVLAVIDALAAKGWITDGRIASWEEHQVRREDTSAERTRAYRERKRGDSDAPVTRCDAVVTQHDAPDTDTDTDTDRTPPTPPRGIAADFSEWWEAYPHKVGKQAADKAYRKARKAVDAGTLLAGVRRYADGKPEDRPWCNPATWLNQGRWDDAPADGSGPGETRPQPRPECIMVWSGDCDWAQLARRMKGHGYRVEVPDAPGECRGPAPPPHLIPQIEKVAESFGVRFDVREIQ